MIFILYVFFLFDKSLLLYCLMSKCGMYSPGMPSKGYGSAKMNNKRIADMTGWQSRYKGWNFFACSGILCMNQKMAGACGKGKG